VVPWRIDDGNIRHNTTAIEEKLFLFTMSSVVTFIDLPEAENCMDRPAPNVDEID